MLNIHIKFHLRNDVWLKGDASELVWVVHGDDSYENELNK
jgi:hypothetical protein